MIEAKILKPGYTQKEALVLLFNTDPKLDLLDIDEVYYPYVVCGIWSQWEKAAS